jgi:hypothetical protein
MTAGSFQSSFECRKTLAKQAALIAGERGCVKVKCGHFTVGDVDLALNCGEKASRLRVTVPERELDRYCNTSALVRAVPFRLRCGNARPA